MEPSAKPDIVLMDRESRQKCSIYPLKYRQDLEFLEIMQLLKHPQPPDTFMGYLFLQVDSPELTEEDAALPLLILDGSWRRALMLTQKLPYWDKVAKRSLHGFVTAYPRVSKTYAMPDTGLASVEALYIARLIQGREDSHLLGHYYWKEQFLEKNQAQIEKWRNVWKQKR